MAVGEQAVRVGLGTQELTGPAGPETLFLPAGPGAADSQSWASCMTTSMQLAQECLRDGPPEPSEPPQPLEGLEMFAQTIETGEQAPPSRCAPPWPAGQRPQTAPCRLTGKLCLALAALPDLRPLPTPQYCEGSR